MKVICRHGHFALYPSDKTEVQHFMRVFKLALYAQEDYFTFEALLDLPRWSQTGRPFGNLPAVSTIEAREAWQVMEENEFVFSLALELLVPRAAITQAVGLSQTLDCALAMVPLIQPGGFVKPGVRLVSYRGEVDLKFQRLYVYDQETVP